MLHLPSQFASEWPPGTLVRIEPEDADRLRLSRPRMVERRRRGGPPVNVLEVRDVSLVIGRPLLADIDLDLGPGLMTALSGPSGSGKTTLLSIVGGLVEGTTGTATYAGRPMWQGNGDPRPEVAFILQVYGLVPILSARENVSIALRARGLDPVEADERAEAALARLHIADLGDRQVEELSGGQMQRVACARGFVVEPEILLADEPTSELDEGNRSLVLERLREEADRGAVVVVATHDPAVVEACDRHYALDEGRLVLVEAVAHREAPPSSAQEAPPPRPEPGAPGTVEPSAAGPASAQPAPAAPPAPPSPPPLNRPRLNRPRLERRRASRRRRRPGPPSRPRAGRRSLGRPGPATPRRTAEMDR
ncbi:MAG: ATP-binding cassette domain-containing protein [Nocardioides sp.]